MLRRQCQVLSSLTTASTLRECERQLCGVVSRSLARALIQKAKARSPEYWKNR